MAGIPALAHSLTFARERSIFEMAFMHVAPNSHLSPSKTIQNLGVDCDNGRQVSMSMIYDCLMARGRIGLTRIHPRSLSRTSALKAGSTRLLRTKPNAKAAASPGTCPSQEFHLANRETSM